jgi:drug/metabolite transporter (DMT)-like permease
MWKKHLMLDKPFIDQQRPLWLNNYKHYKYRKPRCRDQPSPKEKSLSLFKPFFSAITSNATLLLSLSTLFWAGNFVVGRGMHETIPPLAMATLRWSIATMLFFPFAFSHIKHDWPVIKQNFPIIFLLGATGVGCFNSFAYLGLNHTTALNGLIIQSAGPILIILTALLLFGERFAPGKLIGVFISLTGVLVIVTKANSANLLNQSFNKGDLWILAAMGVWALYTVILRKRPDIHPISFTATTFLIGALVNIPGFLWEHFTIRQVQITQSSLATIAYISVFPSIIAYLFWNRGVALIGSNRAGTFLHLIPLFGSTLALLFLGEQPHFYHALGFVLILLGVTIAVRS